MVMTVMVVLMMVMMVAVVMVIGMARPQLHRRFLDEKRGMIKALLRATLHATLMLIALQVHT